MAALQTARESIPWLIAKVLSRGLKAIYYEYFSPF
jgi:hypothetical protein